jgi:hypothetical protein
MTDLNQEQGGASGEALIRCRRTDQDYNCTEHKRCPYCYGSEAEVRSGDHQTFCDYDPERDPINFGFPTNSSRDIRG